MLERSTVSLTLDVNKEPISQVRWMVDLLRQLGVRATFFVPVEQDYHFLQDNGHEIALLPHVDAIPDAKQIISRLKEKYPSAIGMRPFGALHDFRLAPVIRDLGLVYQSSYFVPSYVPPFKQKELFHLPVIFQDLPWVTWGLIPHVDVFDSLFREKGIYTVMFHVGTLYRNASDPADAQAIYEPADTARKLEPWGVCDLFDGFIQYCRQKRFSLQTCSEICERLRDMRDIRQAYQDSLNDGS